MRRILGLILISIGLLGMILPVLPGWIFFIPGVKLLFSRKAGLI
ncbi:hypothetical protein [Thermohalobacter berrensis]|nr:hypothetical protein [Thermohalobacter berrensis]